MKKQIEIETFLQFQFVSQSSFSPDGRFVAFVLQQADEKENTYQGDIWIYDCEKEKVRKLSSGGDGKKYIWTKENTILFPANRTKKEETKEKKETIYYEINPDGGEAEKAFQVPFVVSAIEALDKDIFVLRATFENRKKEEEDYEVFEEYPFWFNDKKYIDGKRERLYLFYRSTGEWKAITEEWAEVGEFCIKDSFLLYQELSWRNYKKDHKAAIFLYNLKTEEKKCLLESGKLRTGSLAFWTEDTALIAASEGEKYGDNQYLDFYTLDLKNGERKLFSKYGASIGSSSVGSDVKYGGGRGKKQDKDSFYFISTIEDRALLRKIKKEGAIIDVKEIGEGEENASCESFDVQNGKIAVVLMQPNKLAQLYVNGKQVTFFNQNFIEEYDIRTPEPCHFTARDGYEIHGWCMKPRGYKEGEKYPAILHIHGGPKTVFGEVYHHEMQVWANAGYFVLFCNPRGSDGRGDDFADIYGKYGTVDYDNLCDFLDEMVKKYPDIKKDRIGVAGGSYGGFMTNWMIGHTDRFRAAVSQRSISNWISFEHTSDIGPNFTKNNHGVTTREDMQKLWDSSPLKYADRCKTPTLFIHSDEDYRCYMVEGVSMFSALKQNGCDAKLCLFHKESHELSRGGKPKNRIARMREIVKWFDTYLKDF